MAYAASVSLMGVLERFYYSPDRFYYTHCPESQPFLDRLQGMAKSMRDFDFDEVRPAGGESLEKQIRDALWRAEDVVESYWLSLLHSSESENSGGDMDSTNPFNFSKDIQEVMQVVESNMERMKMIKHDQKPDSALSSIDDSPPRCENNMVGLDEQLEELKRIVLENLAHKRRLGAIVIHGMGGVGKTSLATSFYNDADVRNYFSIGAWIKILHQHSARYILLILLHAVEVFDQNISSYGRIEDNTNDEVLENIVRERLILQRYIVVVDCLCEINVDTWRYIKSILPDSNNGSRIFLVNRLKLRDKFVLCYFCKRFLDITPSWELLREKVFGDEPFPHVFERIGKKIAKNCQGLPLAIITVGSHLAREEKTAEYWNKIADSRNSIAYASDGSPMFEQLYLSYKQMVQYLRPIFLYLAVFEECYKIRSQQFITLMTAEGFVGHSEYIDMDELFSGWMEYLLCRDLILINETVFSLHHTIWYLCRNLAQKYEFFHVMNMLNDWEDFPPSTSTNNVRRLVVSNNVLLGVDDIFKLEGSILPGIRSILLTGRDHPYPLSISLGGYKMLRVLHARSIRFYEFPLEILSLTLLRYLTLTLNRVEVPCGISRLRNLQFLIVSSLIKVISSGEAPSYLPTEIWEMQQLLHLQVEGSDLPVPTQSDSLLPNLLTLFGVSPHSCRKEVLERIPNLTNLGIRINLAPKMDVHSTPLSPFDHLIQLQNLKHLICTISNPYFEGYPQSQPISMPEGTFGVSMNSLTNLTLRGYGLPWKSIEQITQLPNLKCLNLEHHAFRGPEWELSKECFQKLEFLVLEDLDLVYWTIGPWDFFKEIETRVLGDQNKVYLTIGSWEFFPRLEELVIKACYKLQQIPSAFKRCHHLTKIQVFDSSREAETWARSIQTERSLSGNRSVVVSSLRGKSSVTNL